MRYRYVVRISADDVGSRVVIRWRRPGPGESDEVADVLGVLESVSPQAFVVRKASGEVVTTPRDRVLAAKPIPPAPRRAAP
jgi:hypothetical protein